MEQRIEEQINYNFLLALNSLYLQSRKRYNKENRIESEKVNKVLVGYYIIDFFSYISKNEIIKNEIIKYLDVCVFEENKEICIFDLSLLISKFTEKIQEKKFINKLSETNNSIIPIFNQMLFMYFSDFSEEKIKNYVLNNILYFNLNRFAFLIDLVDLSQNQEQKNKLYEEALEHYKKVLGSINALKLFEKFTHEENEFLEMYSKIYNGLSSFENLIKKIDIDLFDVENIYSIKKLIK